MKSFQEIKDRALLSLEKNDVIGRLSESYLHAFLKYYLADEKYHEVKIGRVFCDIQIGDKIIEIQTKNFGLLRKKLKFLLGEGYYVEVVFPIAENKYLSWIDVDTGEVSKKRKSPKRGQEISLLNELYRIPNIMKNYFGSGKISFSILMMDILEFRNLNGYSKDKKKGSHRQQREPISVNSQIVVRSNEDILKLINYNLEKEFTSKEFINYYKISTRGGYEILKVLRESNIIKQVGKKGNTIIYRKYD